VGRGGGGKAILEVGATGGLTAEVAGSHFVSIRWEITSNIIKETKSEKLT